MRKVVSISSFFSFLPFIYHVLLPVLSSPFRFFRPSPFLIFLFMPSFHESSLFICDLLWPAVFPVLCSFVLCDLRGLSKGSPHSVLPSGECLDLDIVSAASPSLPGNRCLCVLPLAVCLGSVSRPWASFVFSVPLSLTAGLSISLCLSLTRHWSHTPLLSLWGWSLFDHCRG